MPKNYVHTWVRRDDGTLVQKRVNIQDYLDYLQDEWPLPTPVAPIWLENADVADPAEIAPPRSDLPYYLDLPFFKLATRWFHEGLPHHFHIHVLPRLKGQVSDEDVLMHLTVLMNSSRIEHNHKMEALTWLMVNWMEDAHWGEDSWIADGVWLRPHGDAHDHEEHEH